MPRDAEQRADCRGQHRALVSARAGDAAWSELGSTRDPTHWNGAGKLNWSVEMQNNLGVRWGRGDGFPERMAIPGHGVQVYTSDVVV